MRAPTLSRFMRFVSPDPNSGCWLWTGCGDPKWGYCQFRLKGKNIMAHRMAFELMRGEIPEGMQLDHLCRTRCCVNPDHLEVVTPKENSRRSVNHNSIKTACIRGHRYDQKNTYREKANGSRHCLRCMLDRNRAVRAAEIAKRIRGAR